MPNVIEVTGDEFQAAIAGDSPVLVDLWAPWCAPCAALSPILDDIAAGNPALKVIKINIDEELDLANDLRVKNLPTLLIMKSGEIVERRQGGGSKSEILDWLAKAA